MVSGGASLLGAATGIEADAGRPPGKEWTTTVSIAPRKKADAIGSVAVKVPSGLARTMRRLSNTLGMSREYVTYNAASSGRPTGDSPLTSNASVPTTRTTVSETSPPTGSAEA